MKLTFMKYVSYILVLFFIFCFNSFGQSSGGGKVELTVSFDKSIPVEHIRVYYYKTNSNGGMEGVGYIKNSEANTLLLTARHDWFAVPDFDKIIFVYDPDDNPGPHGSHYFDIVPFSPSETIFRPEGWKERIHFSLHGTKDTFPNDVHYRIEREFPENIFGRPDPSNDKTYPLTIVNPESVLVKVKEVDTLIIEP